MQTRVLFFKPGFTGLTAFKPWYPGLTYGGSLVSGRLANRVAYYKQLRGGQMEVWLDSRYNTDDSRRSVLQKRQLKQHHMSIEHYKYEHIV